ncbi:UDP-glycosyltransferase UGT5-like isoform X2 [Anthonomus grandis grandis]|uniref:UDP-glycosyltransferase UGT5-like isoform X2 n=1 Tax=Anthonomus grandis grandis TaxID=2921223 RepID=UPI002165C746|nr:UDP-glycosyltransferase UGT5-like isoform X2 [Anthonomus grandis grandis]
MKVLVFIYFFGIFLISQNKCARILCVFQMPAVSHQATFKPISRTLSLRGHKVVAVTPHPINDSNLTNLTEIDTSKETYEIIFRHGFEFFMSKEIYVSPIMFALGAKLKAPIVGVSSMGGWQGTHIAAGNPNPPALYSEMFLPYNGELTFYERLKSTLYFIWSRLYVYWVAMPRCDKIAKQYLGEDLPYLADLERNVSAIFLNINPILYTPRPMVPTVIPMSFMHIQKPKPLPEDIREIIETAKNGVIYFSLGSNVKSVNIPQRIRGLLMEAFAELPYKVLWKFEKEELPGKPDNVVIRKWLPQQDILAHPNIKAFISQCGLQSTEEAIDREMPMVGIPFIADQEMNSVRLAKWGVLRHVDYLNTTKEELVRTIKDVAENPSYRSNMKNLRALLQDEPMTSLDRVTWWAEYVIRHRGTRHLRSPTIDIEWHKYLLLDVFVVLIGVPALLLLLIFRFVFGKKSIKMKKE